MTINSNKFFDRCSFILNLKSIGLQSSGEQLPKIVGNDILKELITTELHSVLSQIENATRPGGNHSQVENYSCHAFVSLPNDVEVGDEVCVPASHHQQRQSRTGSPPAPRRRTSRMETEMREIRPRSLAR